MSEELIQRNLVDSPEKMGDWNFYNIGATTLKALKSAKIIPDHDYDEYEKKKPDALIVKKPIVIAAIEYKTPQQLRTQKQIEKAIAQELGTARALNAKIYIITDGKKSIWVNPKTGNEITQEDGSKITLNFDKNSTDCINLINKITASITSDNDQIKAPSAVDPLPLAQKVWQDLWAVSGATPENCLYTFVEIFIFKYLSDLGVLQGVHSFYSLISQYGSNTDDDVLDFYAQTIRVKIKQLFPWNPKDKTTIINGTIFVSKDDKAVSGYATVFRRILNRFNDFGTLENIDYDFKSKLFETFLKESISKKNWGQYFTPLKVVRAIVNMVELSAGMKVCDPACGVGKFLLEPILHDLHKFFKVENGKLTPQISLSGFDKGFDKEEQKTIILAKANMLIYMSSMIKENPGITEQFSELFNKTFFLQTNTILGTLAQPIKEEYDLILTNPPYVMSGSSNLKEEISKQDELKAHYTISAMGIEGLFMEWIVRALKPNGKAFIVVPDGIMNRSNDKKLRDFILENCIIDAVISLPLNTFFTTNKKTYILALTKKEPISVNGTPTLEKQTTPVFTYLCSEIGETRDVYRFDIEQNDLEVASDLFNMFKGAKSKFKSEDKRCKIVDIKDFYEGSHWCVERWWTHEERINLGIEERESSISLSNFISFISDVSDSILEFQEPLKELEKKNVNDGQIATVKIGDDSCFQLVTSSIGKNNTILSSLNTNNEDDIPVFSASKYPVAYIERIESKVPIDASEAFPILSVATNGDGSAGRNFILHTKPFYINTDRIAIRSVNNSIVIEFVLAMLRDIKSKYGFNHAHKANARNLRPIEITIPTNSEGIFDVNKQKDIVEIYHYYDELIETLKCHKNTVDNLKVELDLDCYTMTRFKLPLLFSTTKGLAKYTKKYGNTNSGEYPVYSASSFAPLTYINTYDYNGKYMTWSTNGFAGTILILDGKFSINGDRGILVPRDGRTDLDFDYMKFTLEPIFRDMAKGRKGDNGEDEFTKLYPSMLDDVMVPVPVDKDGNIDLNAQKEIAAKYLAVEQCKKDIAEKLQALIDQKVNI